MYLKTGVKVGASFKSVGDVKGLQNFEKTAKASITGVNSAYKRLNEQQQAQVKILQAQQRASLALTAAERKEAIEVEKLILKKQALTKANKDAAKVELGLATDAEKAANRASKARERQVKAESDLRERLSAQRKREQSEREKQVKSESDLRQRLNAQREKQEKQQKKEVDLAAKLGREYNILVAK